MNCGGGGGGGGVALVMSTSLGLVHNGTFGSVRGVTVSVNKDRPVDVVESLLRCSATS